MGVLISVMIENTIGKEVLSIKYNNISMIVYFFLIRRKQINPVLGKQAIKTKKQYCSEARSLIRGGWCYKGNEDFMNHPCIAPKLQAAGGCGSR